MNPFDALRLREAKRQLPQIAMRLGSREAIHTEFMRLYPDLMPTLGESMLDRWIWDSLRQIKEAALADDDAMLPLFGNFGKTILTREDWTEDQYRIYDRRYLNAAERNAAKCRGLAAEFRERFGHGIHDVA